MLRPGQVPRRREPLCRLGPGKRGEPPDPASWPTTPADTVGVPVGYPQSGVAGEIDDCGEAGGQRRVGKQHVAERAFPPGQKLRGDIRWPRRNYDPQAPSPEVSFEYDTASPAAFQPRTVENLPAPTLCPILALPGDPSVSSVVMNSGCRCLTEMVDISPPRVQTGLVSPSPSVLNHRLTAPLFVSGSQGLGLT